MSIIDISDLSVNIDFETNVQNFFDVILTNYVKLFEDFLSEQSKNEALAICGSDYYKHDSNRKNYLNGTRVVPINFPPFLNVEVKETRLRKSAPIPGIIQILERTQINYRNQLCALLHSSGASLKVIGKILRKLKLKPIQKSQISKVIANYRQSDLISFQKQDFSDSEYPILFIDALYEDIKFNDKVYSLACQVVYGINRDGRPELLAISPTLSESKATYTELFDKLQERRLANPVLVVSDAHPGIKEAVELAFPGCVHQLCSVHFIRNCLKKLPEETPLSRKSAFGKAVSNVFKQMSKKEALEAAQRVIKTYQQSYPEAAAYFKKHFMDSLNFYEFPEIKPEKISSSNLIERQNEEFRRRGDSVHVFPSIESYQRILLFARRLCGEDWFDSVLISPEGLDLMMEKSRERNLHLESVCLKITEDFNNFLAKEVFPVLKSKKFFEVFVTYQPFKLFEDLTQINTGFLYAVGITEEGERVSLSLQAVFSSKEEAVKKMLKEISRFDFSDNALLCHDLTGSRALSCLKEQDLFKTIRSRENVIDSILSKIPGQEDKEKAFSGALKELFRSKTLEDFNLKLTEITLIMEKSFPEAAAILKNDALDYQVFFSVTDKVLTLRRTSSPRHFSNLLKTAVKQELENLNFVGLATQVNDIFEKIKQFTLDELNKTAFISGDKIRVIQCKTHETVPADGPEKRRSA